MKVWGLGELPRPWDMGQISRNAEARERQQAKDEHEDALAEAEENANWLMPNDTGIEWWMLDDDDPTA